MQNVSVIAQHYNDNDYILYIYIAHFSYGHVQMRFTSSIMLMGAYEGGINS